MIWKPHVTVAAIVECGRRFLLVEERVDGRLVLNQPAGHLDPGESLIDAVTRETLEETGRLFVPEFVVGIYRWAQPEGKQTFLRTCFAGRVSEQDPLATLDEEIVQTVWLTRAQLVARTAEHRSPQVLRCIDDYLAGRRFPLELLVEVA